MDLELKKRLLDALMEHCLNKDAEKLTPKPKMVGMEVEMVGKKPVEEMHDAINEEKPGMEKGPMEKLMEAKGEYSDMPEDMDMTKMEPSDDDMTDEELEELVRRSQS